MILIWAGACPGLAFMGCAWSIGGTWQEILVAGFSGLLAGLTGGGIVVQHLADKERP